MQEQNSILNVQIACTSSNRSKWLSLPISLEQLETELKFLESANGYEYTNARSILDIEIEEHMCIYELNSHLQALSDFLQVSSNVKILNLLLEYLPLEKVAYIVDHQEFDILPYEINLLESYDDDSNVLYSTFDKLAIKIA